MCGARAEKGIIENSADVNVTGLQHSFRLLMELFGVSLTKYYEAYLEGKVYDLSRKTGYGYDVILAHSESGDVRYIEVKTLLGEARSFSLTLNEFRFHVEEKSPEKWIYVVFLDRGALLGENFDDCFDIFRIPCVKLKKSLFEKPNSSKCLMRFDNWKPIANRCEVILPYGLERVLEQIRNEYLNLFPDRASRVLWKYNHLSNQSNQEYIRRSSNQSNR